MREKPALLFIDSTTLNDPAISPAKETGEGVLAIGGVVQLAKAKHIAAQRAARMQLKFAPDIFIFFADL
jgi:hypothetical protein